MTLGLILSGHPFPEVDKLKGGQIIKTVLITGANRDIGKQNLSPLIALLKRLTAYFFRPTCIAS
jgi:hypothetical protein